MATQRFYDGQPGPDIRRELNNFEAILDGTVASAQAASTAATDSKNAAATSATAAKTSETNAASSASAAAASQTAAATSESAAAASANAAASSASAAAASANAAASSASAAAASANAAAASAGGQLWVSGTNYAVGALVFSPVTGRNYRRIVAGAGTTDPSLDSTNWRATLLDVDTMMPTLRPALLLDFVNSEYVDSRITFARASTATRTNDRGLIETVAANVPRIDFDPVTLACKGLLIEEQRTNLLTYSEQFNNAAWIKTGVTIAANVITAPDGTLTADKLVEDTSTGFHEISIPVALVASKTYVLSVFAKTAERNRIRIAGRISSSWSQFPQAIFDLSSGVVVSSTTTAFIQPFGNGWFRCSIVGTASATNGGLNITVVSANSENTYAGDDTSGLYIWGAQLEVGTFPASYIPTTTAQVTRAADISVMTGSNFSSWYRQDEGTFVADALLPEAAGAPKALFAANDGTNDNTIQVFQAGGFAQFQVNSGATQQALLTKTNGVEVGCAVAYKSNNFAVSFSGTGVIEDTSESVPVVNRLILGGITSGTAAKPNGHIRRIAYYPKRLSNAELQALTTS